jgi:hypothetical protein
MIVFMYKWRKKYVFRTATTYPTAAVPARRERFVGQFAVMENDRLPRQARDKENDRRWFSTPRERTAASAVNVPDAKDVCFQNPIMQRPHLKFQSHCPERV